MRIIFMGTPEFSVPTLSALVGQGYDVVSAYTQPPRPAGRGMELTPSAVEKAARQFGIPVESPLNFKSQADIDHLASYAPDVIVVVAYGLLLPQTLLDIPPLGCYNVHGSLLPRWRGAAPIQRAIMAGDNETGIGIMRMEAGLDTGPVGLEERVPITNATTTQELHDTLARLGADAMLRAIAAIERGSFELQAQPEDGVTYAKKIEKAEARIDWTRPAFEVLRHIHGLSPFPGAWTELGGQRLKILRCELVEDAHGKPGEILNDQMLIACGSGAIRPILVQKTGKPVMDVGSFLRGNQIQVSEVLH